MKQRGLFENYKYCEYCGKPLSLSFEGTVCPACQDQQLFHEVKEFIRNSDDVTEYDVAKHFNIPIQRVKHWIREGRIEYKDNSLNAITMHCTECGAPISFGRLCAKCLKKHSISGYSTSTKESPARMRYFEDSQN